MTSTPRLHSAAFDGDAREPDDGFSPVAAVSCETWRNGEHSLDQRIVPEEAAIALTYNGSTHAVMMATPTDLKAYAVGFSLSEGIVRSASEIDSIDICTTDLGVELRMWLKPEASRHLADRRRHIIGPTGCGLCGVESLQAAKRQLPRVEGMRCYRPEDVLSAVRALAPAQKLNDLTRALHAAAFWLPGHGIVALHEDVGRHNALDKLIGSLALQERSFADGIILLTSRLSIEMVQKAAMAGAPVIVSISAPTAAALRAADRAGITVAGVARADGFQVFTHQGRITPSGLRNAAPGRSAAA